MHFVNLSVPYLSGLLLLPFQTMRWQLMMLLSVPYLSGLLLLPANSGELTSRVLPAFQSPIYRDYYCYAKNRKPKKQMQPLSVPYLSGLLLLHGGTGTKKLLIAAFSPLFIGIIIVTPLVGIILGGYFVPFSPLFIGIIIVTAGIDSRNVVSVFFQSPIYRDYYCYSDPPFSFALFAKLSVPYLSGLLLLLTPSWGLVLGVKNFQSPIYRDYYCYASPLFQKEPRQ